MRRINVKAILIGCLVDWLGTFAFTIASGVSLGITAAVKGLSQQEIQLALIEWSKSIPGMALSLLYGSGFTFLGGYVAARISKTGNLLNAGLVGAIGILFGLFFISEAPEAILLLSLLLSIPVATLGGFCHRRKWVLIWSEERE
jgi:hypothetical protein